MSERDIEEEIMIKAQQNRHLARYMSSTRDLVEEQIRKAQERGDFNNLEGAGKPLNLDENPYEPAELRMAFKILKDNGYAPYWIELGKEIDADMARLARELEYFQRYTEIFVADKHGRRAVEKFTKKKELFFYERRLDLEKLNKKILDYNLQCPILRQGKTSLSIADEMLEAIMSIERIIEKAGPK